MIYQPTDQVLQKYARVLVRFALNSGRGVKKGEVVRVVAHESAKPLYFALQQEIMAAGAQMIGQYLPDDDERYNFSRAYFESAVPAQLDFFPKQYLKGLAEEIDHNIVILSEADKRALAGVEPKKIMRRGEAMKPLRQWLDKKENQGRFTWTIALYGTPAMAEEAGLSLEQYWREIQRACYLDKADSVNEWKMVYRAIEKTRSRLSKMPIEELYVKGSDVDLKITLGRSRRWMGGSGRNVPSFEVFTSPDWRGTEGWIRFNQPLYRYGNLIKGIELEFKEGRVVRSKAAENEKVLKEMIKTLGADKVGEFSLTDKRHSRIKKFMAETLYDENVGGPQGNTHIALGKSYADTYDGDPAKLKKKDWQKLGFNDSSVHTDMMSTTKREVTARLNDGSERVIYKNGQFTV